MKSKRTRRIMLAAATMIGIGALGVSLNAGAQYRGYGMGEGGMGGGSGMMGSGSGMMGAYGSMRNNEENPRRGGNDLNSPAGQLYARTCSRCHALPDPRQHSAGQWPGVVARMEGYMRQRSMPLLTSAEVKDIDAFLQKHADAG